jgi:hypothetical protein
MFHSKKNWFAPAGFARAVLPRAAGALWERLIMRHWKHRRGGASKHAPPFVDPAFAEALAGKSEVRGDRKQNYKALQLCRQVQRVLTLELGGFGGDDVLRDLYIVEVAPVAGSSQLLVAVSIPANVSVVDVLARLERAAPRLRAAVAEAITRKRAPELTFMPVARMEVLP